MQREHDKIIAVADTWERGVKGGGAPQYFGRQ